LKAELEFVLESNELGGGLGIIATFSMVLNKEHDPLGQEKFLLPFGTFIGKASSRMDKTDFRPRPLGFGHDGRAHCLWNRCELRECL